MPLPRPDFSEPAAEICESQSEPCCAVPRAFYLKLVTVVAGAPSGSELQRGPTLYSAKTTQTTATSVCFPPASRHVTPRGAAGVLLSGYRGLAARRAALQKQTPWLVRFFAARRRGIPAAALPGLSAAAARWLHGGAVLRSSVPQQLAPYSELVSLLGRLLGKLTTGFFVVWHPWVCVIGTPPPLSQPTPPLKSFKEKSVVHAGWDAVKFVCCIAVYHLKTEMTT